MREISTALVEQSTLFREGLARILANSSFTVTAMVGRPEDLLSEKRPEPELTLLGSHLHDPNLLKNIISVRNSFQNTRIVVLSDSFEPHKIFDVLRSSVFGCLLKSISSETFIKSLELIMLGERVIPSEVLIDLGQPVGVDERERLPSPLEDPIVSGHQSNLSHREIEIMQLLVRGQSNKEIARHLNIVEATVKVHIKAILRKVRVNNRTQAAIWAMEHQESRSNRVPSGNTLGADIHVKSLAAPIHVSE